MNIEIINKINLVWQENFFLNSLTNWFVIQKSKLFTIVPAHPSPNKYAFTTFILNSSEYLEIKKCTSKIELYLFIFRGVLHFEVFLSFSLTSFDFPYGSLRL